MPPGSHKRHAKQFNSESEPLHAGMSKKQAADRFQRFYASLLQTDIKVFTDGSKLENRMAGGGYALYQSGRLIQQSSFSLGPNKEVFDADVEAALAGVKAAFKLDTARFATNLWVCLDNLEVATRLLSPFAGSSQGVFESFQTPSPDLADSHTLMAVLYESAGPLVTHKYLRMRQLTKLQRRVLPWTLPPQVNTRMPR
ncbi:ribonuclease H family protein [Aspergillus affinis]|uniref:ribonuclease H family protein n=1 Tax=Aspergillus affinis TaxID=1070780 RepID=UPI0022FEE215|nr:uncharacterized protein KD926_002164 [Aspergillus affinis]KAI9036255.1 hypothetical protein KD926_002164 [Aspergillus affinis]